MDESILKTTKVHNALASHFFSQFNQIKGNRQLSRDNSRVEETLEEEADDSAAEEGVVHRLK